MRLIMIVVVVVIVVVQMQSAPPLLDVCGSRGKHLPRTTLLSVCNGASRVVSRARVVLDSQPRFGPPNHLLDVFLFARKQRLSKLFNKLVLHSHVRQAVELLCDFRRVANLLDASSHRCRGKLR